LWTLNLRLVLVRPEDIANMWCLKALRKSGGENPTLRRKGF
jgi:hypothetical protein